MNIVTSILQIRSQDSELLLKIQSYLDLGPSKPKAWTLPFLSFYNPVIESQVTCSCHRCLVKAVCSVFHMPFVGFGLELHPSTNVFAD